MQININFGSMTSNPLNFRAIMLSMKKLITCPSLSDFVFQAGGQAGIHNNPVEEGLVFRAEDYLYSSAADYAGEKGIFENVIVVK